MNALMLFKDNTKHLCIGGIEETPLVLLNTPVSSNVDTQIAKKLQDSPNTPVTFAGMESGDIKKILSLLSQETAAQLQKHGRIILKSTLFENVFPLADEAWLGVNGWVFERDLIEQLLKPNALQLSVLEIEADLLIAKYPALSMPVLLCCRLRGKGMLSFFLHAIAQNSHFVEEVEVIDSSPVALSVKDMELIPTVGLPRLRRLRLGGTGSAKLFSSLYKNISPGLVDFEVRDLSPAGLDYKPLRSTSVFESIATWIQTKMRPASTSFYLRSARKNNPSRKVESIVLVGNGASRFFSNIAKDCASLCSLRLCDHLGFQEKTIPGSFPGLRKCVLAGDGAAPTVFVSGLPQECENTMHQEVQPDDELLKDTLSAFSFMSSFFPAA